MHWHRIIENTLHEFTRKGFSHELDKKTAKTFTLRVQVLFTALTNGYVIGFTEGKIYRGTSKKLCVPGLNCYSCPGAIGSCPIGSLQAVLGSKIINFPFMIIGFLMIFGSLMGRLSAAGSALLVLCRICCIRSLLSKRSKKSHLTAICAI